jgi:TonB family protein
VLTGVAGSLLVHAGLVAALLLSVSATPAAVPPTYAVTLVAAPAPSTATRAAPEARPAAPLASRAPLKKSPAPLPTKPATKPPTRATPASRTASPATPLPGEKPGTGSDIANVDLKGKEFPYPEYLRNLVTQIYRRWNRPAGNAALEAEVSFVILRDGTVREIRMLRSSRSYSFDEEAQGAIEAAAASKAFGALPTGYPADYLTISFLFTPRQLP